MNYKDVLAYEERRMAGKNKAYVVFEIDDDDDMPTAVFATTTKAKAEKYINEHKNDGLFEYFVDVVEFEQ